MNTEANFTHSLEQGVFLKSLLLLTIIKTALSGLKKTHVEAVLTVLFFDVTSCFKTVAEPYGL